MNLRPRLLYTPEGMNPPDDLRDGCTFITHRVVVGRGLWNTDDEAMNLEYDQIATAAGRLADRLPYSVMIALAKSIAEAGSANRSAARHGILQAIPTPDFRDAASDFLDLWNGKASNLESNAVALALMTAAKSERDHRCEEAVEIVWTGPESTGSRFRETEQAILEVINTAKERLTVVSYAVYRIPRIQEALIAAADRGVSIRLIVETPNRAEGQNEYNCLLALGSKVASACSVYYWPHESRPKGDNGKVGILHVKCAVADGHRMFLSSANFTEYAFTINMELGLLITGGKLPNQVERKFWGLIELGILVAV